MLNSFKKIQWTEHAKIKMRQYGLSKGKIMQVLRKPDRQEQGIAPSTLAVMQTKKLFGNAKMKKAPPGEIWLMYRDIKGERRIISCWWYPGISKPGEAVPVPPDIMAELSIL